MKLPSHTSTYIFNFQDVSLSHFFFFFVFSRNVTTKSNEPRKASLMGNYWEIQLPPCLKQDCILRRNFARHDAYQPWLLEISSILSLLFQSTALAFSCTPSSVPPRSSTILLTSQSESSAYWTAFAQLWRETPPSPRWIQWRADVRYCRSINSAAIKKEQKDQEKQPTWVWFHRDIWGLISDNSRMLWAP